MTDTTAVDDVPPRGGWFRRARLRFRTWRRTRPFWGGLLTLLGGAEVLLSEKAPIPVIVHLGAQGLAGYLVPIVIVLCALLLWFNPAQRLFYSILAVIASLATLITANLGGFLLGMLLGIAGGSLAFAWVPGAGPKRGRRRRRGGPAEEGPSAGLALVIGDQEHGDQEPQAGSPEETETEQLWPGPGGPGGPRGGDTGSSWPDPGPASRGWRPHSPPGAPGW